LEYIRTVGYLANSQLVSIWMLLGRLNLRNNHTAKNFGRWLGAIYLKPRHGHLM
jgi:hypothetical protein